MASASGQQTKLGIKKATVWGTAVACGAGSGVEILPSGIKRTAETLRNDSLGGKSFTSGLDMGAIKAEGGYKAYLRYVGHDLPLALVFGATGGTPTQQGSTTAYAQKLTLADLLDGLFATCAEYNGAFTKESPSVKFNGLSITGEAGKAVEVEYKVIANDQKTDSSVNTNATMTNVTMPAGSDKRVLFSQGVFRMNDQTGAALGSGDAIYPTKFQLDIDRPVEGVYAQAAGANVIDEPTNNGQATVKLKLTFERVSSDALRLAWVAGTEKKMDMTFTGSLIASTYYNTFKLSFPRLVIKEEEAPNAAGRVLQTVEFEGLIASAAPTGMTGITLPVQADIINTVSANVLA